MPSRRGCRRPEEAPLPDLSGGGCGGRRGRSDRGARPGARRAAAPPPPEPGRERRSSCCPSRLRAPPAARAGDRSASRPAAPALPAQALARRHPAPARAAARRVGRLRLLGAAQLDAARERPHDAGDAGGAHARTARSGDRRARSSCSARTRGPATPRRARTRSCSIRVDPSRQQIAELSIPRDLRTEIPGYSPTKINAAYAYGGPPLAIRRSRTSPASRSTTSCSSTSRASRS